MMEQLLFIAVLIFSIVVHECAHGVAAERAGDPTARMLGRITLNPIPHIDLIGSIALPALLIISGSPFLFRFEPDPLCCFPLPQHYLGCIWRSHPKQPLSFRL
jgi:Zn-dependent protease